MARTSYSGRWCGDVKYPHLQFTDRRISEKHKQVLPKSNESASKVWEGVEGIRLHRSSKLFHMEHFFQDFLKNILTQSKDCISA